MTNVESIHVFQFTLLPGSTICSQTWQRSRGILYWSVGTISGKLWRFHFDHYLLTHCGLDKMVLVLQTVLQYICWKKILYLIQISLELPKSCAKPLISGQEHVKYSGVLNNRTYRNKWTLGKICRKTITPVVEHLFYTISIATNKRTPGTFLSLRK